MNEKLGSSAAIRTQLIREVEAFLLCDLGVINQPGASSEDRFTALVQFQRRLNEKGLVVPSWPIELGGRGVDVSDASVVSRALGRGGAPELINFVATEVLAPALFKFAAHENLVRWMPPMASAEEIWCQMFSEPDAGSDLTSLRTRAEKTTNGTWKVNGQKVWSTWAQFARWGLLLARTGSAESRHRGITAFVIDMRSDGVDVRPLQTMTGSSEFSEVYFDDLEISDAARIGDVDGGWAVALSVLNAERGPYAIRRAALIERSLILALEQAREESPAPVLRHEVVRAYISCRLLENRIETLVDQLSNGVTVGPESALTKLMMTNAEQQVSALRGSLQGSRLMSERGDSLSIVVEEYLYSRAASIYGGSSEIQRNVIGERLLGLPR